VLAAVRGKAVPADVALVSATMSKAIKKLVSSRRRCRRRCCVLVTPLAPLAQRLRRAPACRGARAEGLEAPLQVGTLLPDVVQLQTASTHKAVAGSRHEFASVPPGRDRLDMLRDIIEPEVRQGGGGVWGGGRGRWGRAALGRWLRAAAVQALLRGAVRVGSRCQKELGPGGCCGACRQLSRRRCPALAPAAPPPARIGSNRPALSATRMPLPQIRQGRKVLVFCNTMDSCRAVEHFCVET
jgi:hypothetical protein